MKRLNCKFESIMELADYISDSYKEKKNYIDVVANEDIIRKLIKEMIVKGYDIGCIDFSPEWSGYDYEYSLSIIGNEIYVEKNRNENGEFMCIDADFAMIHEDVDKKVYENDHSTISIKFGIKDNSTKIENTNCEYEEFCDDCCSDCTLEFGVKKGEELSDLSEIKNKVEILNDGHEVVYKNEYEKDGIKFFEGKTYYSSNKLTERDIQSFLQELL